MCGGWQGNGYSNGLLFSISPDSTHGRLIMQQGRSTSCLMAGALLVKVSGFCQLTALRGGALEEGV